MCTWHQDTLGQRSMIDFVVVSDPLAGEEAGKTWQTQTYCEGLLGMSGRTLCRGDLLLPPPGELWPDSEGSWGHWRLRRGKQSSTNTVYSEGGELLTSTGDIIRRWKEYFEDLLNPTDMPSIEEAEAGDSEVDPFITQADSPKAPQWQSTGDGWGLPWVPQVSGCCGAVMVDTSLQHCVTVGDSGGCVATIGGSHSLASLVKSIPGYWRGEFGW